MEDIPFSGKSERKLYIRGYLFAILNYKKRFFCREIGKAFQAENMCKWKGAEFVICLKSDNILGNTLVGKDRNG